MKTPIDLIIFISLSSILKHLKQVCIDSSDNGFSEASLQFWIIVSSGQAARRWNVLASFKLGKCKNWGESSLVV